MFESDVSKLKKPSSIGSERELDNLNELNSLTSTDFRNMSWPADSDFSAQNEQFPQRPGTGRPPHHRKLKKKDSKSSSVSWSINLSDGKNSPDNDKWGKEIDPLPEPQTDVPVFSLATAGVSTNQDNVSRNNASKSPAFDPYDVVMRPERHKHKSKKKKKRQSNPELRLDRSASEISFENEPSTYKESAKENVTLLSRPSQDSKQYTTNDRSLNVQKGGQVFPPIAEETKSDSDNEDGSTFQLPETIHRPAETAEGTLSKELNQRLTSEFISMNFKQRDCSCYVPQRKNNSTICMCGREKSWHEVRRLSFVNEGDEREKSAGIWHQKTHTVLEPCDSFGEILFQGFGNSTPNSPYIRVDYKTPPALVWELMIDYWKMPKPRLLLSITGGAQRFELKPRLSSLLKQGLIGAAVNTGAWIITGGTATGVMEFVGEAVRDHITVAGKDEQCVALGIATWGCVANKVALDGFDDKGYWPVTYAIEDVMNPPKGCIALDRNHTHFLLIDNGKERQFGAEIKYRSQLESYISQVGTTGVTEKQVISIPNVLIVVEGGVGTMETVYESLSNTMPVVIIKGSGRAADYIALAYDLTRSPANEDVSKLPSDFDEIMDIAAERMFTWKENDSSKQKKKNDCVYFLKESLKKRPLINVFDLEKTESVKDIDRAILCALLKANKANCKSQLALALAWNRCDIARQQIFTTENRNLWKMRDLYDAMFTALVQNRPDFVQLFMDNGVDLRKFLTVKTLWNLYCNCLADESDGEATILRHYMTFFEQTWSDYLRCRALNDWDDFRKNRVLYLISKILVRLMRDESFCFYPDKEPFIMPENETISMEWKGDTNTIQPLLTRMSMHRERADISIDDQDPDEEDNFVQCSDFETVRQMYEENVSTEAQGTYKSRSRRHKQKLLEKFDFDHPERELFIFSILFNRRKMASLFLQIGTEQIGTSLFGCALLKALAHKADMDEEASISSNITRHAEEMEAFACNVLSECYNRNKADTHLILTRELKFLGRTTLLMLAERHDLMAFAEHSACQTKLTDIWKGHLTVHTSELKVFITILLPFLIFFIKFKDITKIEEEGLDTKKESEEVTQSEKDNKNIVPSKSPRFAKTKLHLVDSTRRTKFAEVRLFSCGENGINIYKAYRKFYKTPVTKFYTNVLAYLIFLALFSYFCLTDLRPVSEPDSPSVIEIIVWVWFATNIMEEGRQLFIGDQRSFLYKLRNYFSNYWNQFDVFMYLGVITSIIMRYLLDGSDFNAVRILYSLTLAMSYLRTMQFFFAEKNMGPKVIMIRRMLTDLMFFFLILLVFLLSFGVAYHVNMFPNAPPNWSILVNILYYPYFQIYGELFIEEFKGDNDCTNNETIWREDPMRRCASNEPIVFILLSAYMVLTNILLVNLLIAMFSYTFQTVQDNSTKVWRFYRISLVFEFFDRPSLVPPIIILNHIFRFIRYILYKKGKSPRRRNHFRTRLSENNHLRLSLLEKAAMETHLAYSSLRAREQLDQRVASTAERLEAVMTDLQCIKETVQIQEEARLALLSAADRSSRAVTPSGRQSQGDMMRMDSQTSLPPMNFNLTSRDDLTPVHTQLRDLQHQASQNTIRLEQVTKLMEKLCHDLEEKQKADDV